MALWGQGDPRWIVEERPDTHNVNNWHWTEKDATSWSKEELKSLFLNVKYEGDEGHWKVNEVTKTEGEASVNNRKGKLILFYDWVIKMEFAGSIKDDTTEFHGYIEVNNLGEENEVDDLDIMVTCKGTESYELKTLVRKTGIPFVREVCGQYVFRLKQEFTKGMLLPSKDGKEKPKAEPKSTPNIKNSPNINIKQASSSKGTSNVNITKLKLDVEFKTTAEELYGVMTTEQLVACFTRAKAEVDAQPAGKFSILDGSITGEFVELVPEKKIVQKWRFKDWPSDIYSIVTMDLSAKEDVTLLKLTQTGVPEYDFQRTEEGWKRHYFESIKRTFGFGARLF